MADTERNPSESSHDIEKEAPAPQPEEKPNPWATRPDGGLLAWLQVVGAFFLLFNAWGLVNAFGVFQQYYQTGELFDASASTISWIGSVQVFLLLVVGALSGPIFDAGYFRHLIATGCFMITFGTMMNSLVKEYYQALLAQGFCVGIGAGLLFVPSVAILPTYFSKKIPIAIGLASSGSSVGGIIYPVVFHRLLPQIGFGWATRVLGFMCFATLLIPLFVLKVRIPSPGKRALWDWSAFKEPQWFIFTWGMFLGFMGLFVPFFYVQIFAETRQLASGDLPFYLLAILNAASIFGRILPNFVASYVGPMNMMSIFAAVSAILIWCLLSIHNLGGIVVFVLFFGFFSGTFVSLPPTVFIALTKDHTKIGTRMGMGFSLIAFGALAGTPIAGAILNGNGFGATWNFSAATVLACGFFVMLARFFENKSLIAKV